MPSRTHWLSVRRSVSRTTALDAATVLLALAIFGTTFALRRSLSNAVDADELVPVALLALRFGRRGGLAGALAAVTLTGLWDLVHDDAAVTILGYLSRGIAFVLIGVFLGAFIDQRRRLEAELLRYFDASLDLLATADHNGRFTRVNPAWETALGYTREQLCSRPLIEFVHPDDRRATLAELAALVEGSRDTVRFRNRYLAADGSEHWLEWSAHGSCRDGLVHAAARDITTQVEAERQLANSSKLLETKVAERTRELDEARAETLQRLARAGEYRDDETFQHTERVGATAAEIAAQLGLDSEQVELIREAAPLHDIGKLAVPDGILLKPGPLADYEREVMQGHAEAGRRVLSGSGSPVLKMASVIAASHHERWDGTGYPAGLSGEAIPLVGRVVAVADVYDALTHDRPYKSAWPAERAIAEIKRAAGSHFDPRVVAAFLATRELVATPLPQHLVQTGEDALVLSAGAA
jgi:putative two-component system response regulator